MSGGLFSFAVKCIRGMIQYYDLKKVNESFGRELSDAVCGVVRSGWYVGGKEVEAFEREFAEYVGTRFCIGVGNGLDALTAVLLAWKQMYGWHDGDEVILPANTFIATALAVSRVGLKPVFCDAHADVPVIDETEIEALVTPRTRAVIPVHLYGMMCRMDRIDAIAHKYGLKVLEDACQAHGAVSGEARQGCGQSCVRAGHAGDAAAFSFYPAKNLGCMGDGGAVTTDDGELAAFVRSVSNYGQTVKYVHDRLGFNSRLDEVQAAVLRVKLRRLDSDNVRRREIAHYYSTHISHPSIELLPDITGGSHVYHIYAVRCTDRERLRTLLLEKGVECLVHYPIPLHRQKAYADCASMRFPAAERWAASELSLPVSQVMTDGEIRQVVDCINRSIF